MAIVLDSTDLSIIAEISVVYRYSRIAIKRIYSVTSRQVEGKNWNNRNLKEGREGETKKQHNIGETKQNDII